MPYDKENGKRLQREWFAANPNYQREYRSKNKDKERENNRRAYEKRKLRRVTDTNFKLAASLRNRLNLAIKGNYKSGSAVGDLGCSIEEFKAYMESKFKPGMTWDNWSKTGWNIDHIEPLFKFDLTDADQLKKACHYTNLQPLWVEDHKIKTAKDIL
jgi:hypothetical protein